MACIHNGTFKMNSSLATTLSEDLYFYRCLSNSNPVYILNRISQEHENVSRTKGGDCVLSSSTVGTHFALTKRFLPRVFKYYGTTRGE